MLKLQMSLKMKVRNSLTYLPNCIKSLLTLGSPFPDENEATTSFLMQLSTWDKEELDDKLANRVQVSKRAVAKVIQAFDRLMQRNEKITLALKGALNGGQLWNLLQSCPEECMPFFLILCFES